jgi:hypothetical protein|tara:strand:+ start:310 stop:1479 length:1170 start_codon:yes stop_codon:yes gene_type:complete
MSIKNIIQQENDLQEMSTQSLANYLNNPTGQYNPYLVAGELQRKEAFAQRQITEAPQGTVVDELVATAAPMGGMPMVGMPMPRPEEMVSESITETGIANLPAPNIGQNYADGGIVGYAEGTLVGEDDPYAAARAQFEKDKADGKQRFNANFMEYAREFNKEQPLTNEEFRENLTPLPTSMTDIIDVSAPAAMGEEVDKLVAKENKRAEDIIKQAEIQKESDRLLREQEARAKGLAALKASENKANSRAERDAYLALAMGGAKTMAGLSPFALTNIGEGLGAGIGALSQSDANERARVDAQRTAYEKYMYDMNANQRLSGKEYGDMVETVQESELFRVKLAQKAEKNNTDIDDPQYQVLIQETIQEVLPLYTSSRASNSTTVNGKPFSRV